jgi:RND family efflux transporter MFP subunit
MKILLPVVALTILLACAACKDKVKPGSTEVKREEVSGVTLSKISASTVDTFYETSGTVKARTVSVVASRTMGTVREIRVKEGDRVVAGDLLMLIDDRDTTQKVRAAEAGYREAQKALEAASQQKALAEVTWQRYGKLFDEKVISGQEMDQIETQKKVAFLEFERAGETVARARALFEEARVFHGFTRIESPVSGEVTGKRIEAGSMATPGSPLFIVEDTALFRIEAPVDERLAGRLKRGVPIEVLFDHSGKSVTGTITEVVPVIDPATRTFLIKAALKAPDLRTGLYGRVLIPEGIKELLLVPKRSVVNKGQLSGVYASDEMGILAYRLVRTGRTYGDRVEVLSGLKIGDRIVTDGMDRAVDGGIIKK